MEPITGTRLERSERSYWLMHNYRIDLNIDILFFPAQAAQSSESIRCYMDKSIIAIDAFQANRLAPDIREDTVDPSIIGLDLVDDTEVAMAILSSLDSQQSKLRRWRFLPRDLAESKLYSRYGDAAEKAMADTRGLLVPSLAGLPVVEIVGFSRANCTNC